MKKQTTKAGKLAAKPVDNKKTQPSKADLKKMTAEAGKEKQLEKAAVKEEEISTEIQTETAPVAVATTEVKSETPERKIRYDGMDFEGSTENLEKIIVNKHVANLSYMQHLPVPLTPDEVVYVHPVQDDVTNGYVRVIHGEQKRISTFSYMTLNGPPVAPVAAEVATTPTTPTTTTAPQTAAPQPKTKVEKPKAGVVVNGSNHSKSGAVLAIVKDYCEKHPGLTVEQLKEIFPDTMLRRFGIFQEVAAAKKIANGGNRYFFKDEQQISLADGKIAVCNQITSDNIKPMLDKARTLGYEITVNE